MRAGQALWKWEGTNLARKWPFLSVYVQALTLSFPFTLAATGLVWSYFLETETFPLGKL